jgi:hypothetical protein
MLQTKLIQVISFKSGLKEKIIGIAVVVVLSILLIIKMIL